jgi:hypothetical protein
VPHIDAAADEARHQDAVDAVAPDVGEFVEPDHDLADAAQPLGVKTDADGEGRGAPAERPCLGRCPCGATHHRSGFPVVADAEKRTVAAVVVVSQGYVVAVGIAAQIAQGLERGSAPTFAWFLAARGDGAISAQDLPMRIRDPLLIAW